MFKVGSYVRCVFGGYTTFVKGENYLVVAIVEDGREDYRTLINNCGERIDMFMSPDFEPVTGAPTFRATDPATSKGKRKVNKYEQAVLNSLRFTKEGRTGKEIASDEEHPLNCITPRFAPLRRKGLIKAATTTSRDIPTVLKRDKQIVWVLA